ncbi:MAG TPA: hypothetical protein VGP94_03210, partial [Tepidisphaeraceae bacterium]|nr:hypothetical protein [Tepidisphaeraceae bacterium]
TRAVAEALESRTLLSLAPVGGEVHVNTYTPNFQGNPAIAADADGDMVVVWESIGQEGTGNTGIYAQRFNSSGTPIGGEIHVNVNTTGGQIMPAVAMDVDGDFTVAWQDNSQEGSGNAGIFARRFDALGNALSGEIHVNNTFDGNQSAPAIAMDSAGNFVVAFESATAPALDVYARRFDSAGVPQGLEFPVTTVSTMSDRAAAVAMDATGDFVVTWLSYSTDFSTHGIFARRYNSAGVAQSGIVPVNSSTTPRQFFPSIAMDPAGDYVIAWQEFDPTNGIYGIYAQRYNPAGAAQGANIPVSTSTDARSLSSTGMSASGGFLVSWQSYPTDGSGFGVYARQFAPNGSPVANEFRVNSTTNSDQFNSAVATDANGNYVVAWQSADGSDPSAGVFAQRYQESAADTAAPIVAGAFLNGNRIRAYSSHAGPLQQLSLGFSENMSDAGGPTGTTSITNPANWLISRNGIDITSDVSSINFGYRASTNRYEATLNFTTSYTSGNFLLKIKDNVRDIAGNRLDGNFNGAPLGNFVLPFSVAPIVRGNEFQVNTYTPQNQAGSSIGVDGNGNFVIAWTDSYNGPGSGQDGSGAGVYLRRFDANGNPLSGEIMVPSSGIYDEYSPVIGMAADGRFVVIWEAWNRDGN